MTRTRLRGLEIAGIRIGIEVPPSCAWEWPAGPIAEYACLPRDPEVHIGVRVGKVDQPELSGECYALGGWTFEVARRGEDWILGLSREGRREQLAFFDKDFRAGEIVISSQVAGRSGYPLQSPLDEWIVLHRLVAAGGLCLTATAIAQTGGARIRLGASESNAPGGWTTPSASLLGRNTVWVREISGRLSVFQTPWGDSMGRALGSVSKVVDICVTDESDNPYRELLDPTDAADLLVTHAVVPVCDEDLLERVMHNAQRMGERARVLRLGESKSPPAPMAWQSPQLQSGFAPPGGGV